MRRTVPLLLLIGVLSAPPAATADPQNTAGAAAVTVAAAPRAIRVIAGTGTGTPGSLAARHEFGSLDRPAGYLRLDPGIGRSVTIYRFRVSESHPLDLRSVFRTAAPERWRIEAWNSATGSWDRLYRGRNAPGGRWAVRLLPLAATHRDGTTIRIRVVGRGEPLALDQLTLHSHPGVWRPGPGTTWQWQLNTGRIDTSLDVEMYDVDLVETPQARINQLHRDGRVVICYFSGGSWEEYRPDAADFPAAVRGNTLDGWPDEQWLDIRQIDLLGPIMTARLDLAAEKGCDGVEPDNMDGYANDSGFPLTGAHQLAYNRWLARQARQRGLSIGLKNDLDQVPQLVGRFDWALNEQCFEYDECRALVPFVTTGKAVFGVEYSGRPDRFCPKAEVLGFSWMKKRLRLDAWALACWDL